MLDLLTHLNRLPEFPCGRQQLIAAHQHRQFDACHRWSGCAIDQANQDACRTLSGLVMVRVRIRMIRNKDVDHVDQSFRNDGMQIQRNNDRHTSQHAANVAQHAALRIVFRFTGHRSMKAQACCVHRTGVANRCHHFIQQTIKVGVPDVSTRHRGRRHRGNNFEATIVAQHINNAGEFGFRPTIGCQHARTDSDAEVFVKCRSGIEGRGLLFEFRDENPTGHSGLLVLVMRQLCRAELRSTSPYFRHDAAFAFLHRPAQFRRDESLPQRSAVPDQFDADDNCP